jgi:vacuolar-type H+-ATPase subunit E/Vma4
MGSEADPRALIGAIEERAAAERERLIAEAEARAGEIRAAAETECERLKAEAAAGLEKELAAEEQRLIGEARMRARARGLESRRRLLEEAFQRARKEIDLLKAGPGLAATLAALAEEARAAVGEPCAVDVAEDGRVTATSPDGNRRAENSLDGRLLRATTAAEHLVAERLFGGTGAVPLP